jgi:hypothetical protein
LTALADVIDRTTQSDLETACGVVCWPPTSLPLLRDPPPTVRTGAGPVSSGRAFARRREAAIRPKK